MTDHQLETRLATMLRKRADDATPRPDLDAVCSGTRAVVLTGAGASHRRGRALAAAVAATLVVGAIAAGVVANRSRHTVAPASSNTLTSTCMVFLEPSATADEVDSIGALLRTRPDTVNLRYVSQGDAYEEFARLFADETELVASVEPDVLPPSWRYDSPELSADAQAALLADVTRAFVLESRCRPHGERPSPVLPSTTAATGTDEPPTTPPSR